MISLPYPAVLPIGDHCIPAPSTEPIHFPYDGSVVAEAIGSWPEYDVPSARDCFGSVHAVVGLGGVSWSGRAQGESWVYECAAGGSPPSRLGPRLRLCARVDRICWREATGRCTRVRVCFGIVHVVVGLGGVSWSVRAQRWELCVRVRGGRIPSPERCPDASTPSGGRPLAPGRPGPTEPSRAARSPLCTGVPDLLEGTGWPVHKGACLLRLCARGGRLGPCFVVGPCTKVGAVHTSTRRADPFARAVDGAPSPERWTDPFARAVDGSLCPSGGRTPIAPAVDGSFARAVDESHRPKRNGWPVHKGAGLLRLCARGCQIQRGSVALPCTKCGRAFAFVHGPAGPVGEEWPAVARRRGSASALCTWWSAWAVFRGRAVHKGWSCACECAAGGSPRPAPRAATALVPRRRMSSAYQAASGRAFAFVHGPAGHVGDERLAGAQRRGGADFVHEAVRSSGELWFSRAQSAAAPSPLCTGQPDPHAGAGWLVHKGSRVDLMVMRRSRS
jgi:hypothetical protein